MSAPLFRGGGEPVTTSFGDYGPDDVVSSGTLVNFFQNYFPNIRMVGIFPDYLANKLKNQRLAPPANERAQRVSLP
jgi:hypothetical protein